TAASSGWRRSSAAAAPRSSGSAANFLSPLLFFALPLWERVPRRKAARRVRGSMTLENDPSPASLRPPLSPTRGEGKKRRQLLSFIVFFIVVALSAPAYAQSLTCRTGAQSTAVAELMFGRKIGDRIGV